MAADSDITIVARAAKAHAAELRERAANPSRHLSATTSAEAMRSFTRHTRASAIAIEQAADRLLATERQTREMLRRANPT